MIDANKAAEKKLCELLGKDDVKSEYMKEITRAILYKLNKDDLIEFIIARVNVPKSCLPNKGKVANDDAGEKNLLKVAIDICELPILLQKQLDEINNDESN